MPAMTAEEVLGRLIEEVSRCEFAVLSMGTDRDVHQRLGQNFLAALSIAMAKSEREAQREIAAALKDQ